MRTAVTTPSKETRNATAGWTVVTASTRVATVSVGSRTRRSAGESVLATWAELYLCFYFVMCTRMKLVVPDMFVYTCVRA